MRKITCLALAILSASVGVAEAKYRSGGFRSYSRPNFSRPSAPKAAPRPAAAPAKPAPEAAKPAQSAARPVIIQKNTVVHEKSGSGFMPALIGGVAGSAIGGALFHDGGKEVVKCFDAQDAEIACPPTAGE